MELFDTSEYELHFNCDPRQMAGYIPEKVVLPPLKSDQENPRDFQVGDRVNYRGEPGIVTDVQGVTVRVKFETSEGEGAWLDIQYLTSLTSAQELGQDFHLQDSSSEDLTLPDSVSEMNIAEISSRSDSKASKLPQTSGTCAGITPLPPIPLSETGKEENSICSVPALPANHSQFKANVKEGMTSETASLQSSKLPELSNQDLSASKTCEDSSIVRTNQEENSSIFNGCLPDFTSTGTMRNGKLSQVGILERPGLESDCSWLDSPGALSSSTSRSPGLNKLEGSLKKKKILLKGECLNPAFLERGSGLPLGWTDPSELRAATQLLEDDEKRSEMHSTPELQPLPCDESSTSTALSNDSTLNEKQCLGIKLKHPDQWEIGDRFIDGKLSQATPFEVLARRNGEIQIKFDNHPKAWYPIAYLIHWCPNLRFAEQSLGKSEQELTPVDESAIGKHFWCDRLTVAVEVLEVRNWRETPRTPTLTKVARCRPWWCFKGDSRLFPDVVVVPLADLVELEPENFLVSLPGRSPELECLGTSRPRSNAGRKPGKNYHTGSLYQYTSLKTLKSGERKEFPPVEGERDKLEDSHWYWGFSYIESLAGKRRDRSAPVKGKSLELIRWAIAQGLEYQQILRLCRYKFLWYEAGNDWAYGETSPSAFPRAVLAHSSGELWISKPSTKCRKFNELKKAIADGKSFLEIVEILERN